MDSRTARAVLAGLEPMREERQLKVVIDEGLESTLQSVLQHYEKIALQRCWHQDGYGWLNFQLQERILSDLNKMKSKITPALIERFILKATNISLTYKTCSKNKKHSNTKPAYIVHNLSDDNAANNTGVYISALVQLSYNAGHNNILLPVEILSGKSAIHHLGFNLHGKENKLKITTIGRTGPETLILSENVDITVYDCLSKDISGSSHNCIFRSNSKDTLNVIMKKFNSDCKFYLLKPDGTESLFAKI